MIWRTLLVVLRSGFGPLTVAPATATTPPAPTLAPPTKSRVGDGRGRVLLAWGEERPAKPRQPLGSDKSPDTKGPPFQVNKRRQVVTRYRMRTPPDGRARMGGYSDVALVCDCRTASVFRWASA